MDSFHSVQLTSSEDEEDVDTRMIDTEGKHLEKMNEATEKSRDIESEMHSAGNENRKCLSHNSSFGQENDEDNFFKLLPNEIVHHIFGYLSTQDLCRVSLACKDWQMYASDPNFWTRIEFKHKDTSVPEVCKVIERMPCLREIRLFGLETLCDENFRQIVSICPATVKSLDMGFLPDLGRDSILALVEYLPNLEQLNLEGSRSLNNNCITALIKLKALTDLNISHCAFVEDIHVQTIVSNLPLLETLNIDGIADVSESTVRKLWQHCGTWLKHLFVDGANLTDLAMEFVSRCTELETFTQSFGDNLTDAGLRHILTMKKLTKLKLRKCSGFSTEAIEQLFKENEALSRLKVLDMSECIEFNDEVVVAMADRCHNLEELALCWCWDITDAGVSVIVDNCPAMKELDLTGLDKIKGDGFQNIPDKMPFLVNLNLGQCNQINDDLLRTVVKMMPKLTAYNYYGIKFGGTEDIVVD